MTLDSKLRSRGARRRRSLLIKGALSVGALAIVGAIALGQDGKLARAPHSSAGGQKILKSPKLNTLGNSLTKAGVVRGGPNDYEPNAILVQFNQTSFSAKQNAVGLLGLQVDTRVQSPYFARLIIPEEMLEDGYGVPDMIAMLKSNPAVKTAEPDYHIYALQASPPQYIPDDPMFKSQWALLNDGQEIVPGQPGGTPGIDVGASFAWPITKGSKDTVVAVVDTGVNYVHNDFYNVDFSETNILANSNGSVIGYDYINLLADPFDDNGHGTEVAGIIGAVADNTFGISGVCPTVKILPVKVLDSLGTGTVTTAVLGIDFARTQGADIINFSAGVGADSLILKEAVQRTGRDNILFVAPAGNGAPAPLIVDSLIDLVSFGKDVEFNPIYPAAYNKVSSNVISVAATDYDDNLAPFSNYGTSVDIAAPGVNVLTTIGFDFTLDSGTSFASAHVAGAAALIKSRFKTISALDIKSKLLKSADHIPFLTGKVAVARRLSAYNPLLNDTKAPAVPKDLAPIKHSNSTLLMRFKATNDGGAGSIGRASYYDARVSTSPITEANFNDATWVGAYVPTGAAGSQIEFAVSGLFPGQSYYVALKAFDLVGNPSPMITTGPVSTRSQTFFSDRVEGAPQFTPQLGSLWSVTTEQSYSPTHCWTDSPGRKYNNNVDQSLTVTNAVTLSTNMLFQFQAKTDLEDGADFLFIEVAPVNASGNPVGPWQQLGQLTGKHSWTFFNMAFPTPQTPADNLIGKDVKFRFRMKTNGQNTADGVYIDDIRIVQAVSPFFDTVNPLFPRFVADGGFEIGDSTVSPNPPSWTPNFMWTDTLSGDYPNNMDARLTVSDPIDSVDLAVPTVDFYLQSELDTDTADYLYLEVSYDFGNTWRRWGAYTGSTGYVHKTEFSPAYAGYDLMFRYHMVTDNETTADGVYLDNMRLQGEPMSTVAGVQSMTLSKTSVVGGSAQVVNLTITLDSPAPAGGLKIPLTSSSKATASVPSYAVFNKGKTSVKVPVTHKVVAADKTVTFTAGKYVDLVTSPVLTVKK